LGVFFVFVFFSKERALIWFPNSDNARFASVGGDRNVFLWDVTTARTTRRLGGPHGHSARINSVYWGGTDDSVIISGSFDASVRIWDTKSNSFKPIQVLADAKDSISAVMVNGREGHEIVTGSVDGRVRYYDLRMGRMDTDVLPGPVTSLAGMRGGEATLVGTLDGKVRFMDRVGGGCLMTYKGHVNREFRIGSTFGGKEGWVLSGSEAEGEDGEVVVWNTVSGEVIKRVAVRSVAEQDGGRKRILGSDGKEKRRNVISCVAWKNEGRGDQWCCAGTDGVVTVFGEG
jgi:mitogen-activated protein kinase organizer 1